MAVLWSLCEQECAATPIFRKTQSAPEPQRQKHAGFSSANSRPNPARSYRQLATLSPRRHEHTAATATCGLRSSRTELPIPPMTA